jgi:hypothetical protein
MISCGFLTFSSAAVRADTGAMPGGDAPSPVARSHKKHTPTDMSVSPVRTKRGSPPKKKLKQQGILLSMRSKSRHEKLVQAAEELG